MIDDAELLARFSHDGCEESFAELVRRHLDRVYSVALRQVNGDVHLAKDICQIVFTLLARKASTLRHCRVLGSWLHHAAHCAAVDGVRSASRRRHRESAAFALQLADDTAHEPDWERLRPALDELLANLEGVERDSVWLRFYAGRSYAEIATQVGLTENAARMRVARALRKMAAALGRRGIRSTDAALGLVLAQQPLIAAPSGWATTVAMSAIKAASFSFSATLTTMTTLLTKPAFITTGGVALTVALSMVWLHSSGVGSAPAPAAPTPSQQALTASESEGTALAPAHATATPHPTAGTTPTAGAWPEPARPAPSQDRLPVAWRQPPTPYPASLRDSGVSGSVHLEFTVDAAGRVVDVHVDESAVPELALPALEAVQSWQFQSGIKGGRAVNTRLQVDMVFDPLLPEAVVGPVEPRMLTADDNHSLSVYRR